MHLADEADVKFSQLAPAPYLTSVPSPSSPFLVWVLLSLESSWNSDKETSPQISISHCDMENVLQCFCKQACISLGPRVWSRTWKTVSWTCCHIPWFRLLWFGMKRWNFLGTHSQINISPSLKPSQDLKMFYSTDASQPDPRQDFNISPRLTAPTWCPVSPKMTPSVIFWQYRHWY